ncbi:rna-directed dna polymerase from mobile element jockey-like [Limosa lapponica baueri]|uniref:Rna-directed dna polymerase from mobile element jockey-like n=1 Tax=Limosa lapponica baueri TaxID=1758121 RepID=A0A2I0UT53_LIMLA|nr:rna-directed dna polymerase from mobile element jockey-like [Limosa lapponica baueri]
MANCLFRLCAYFSEDSESLRRITSIDQCSRTPKSEENYEYGTILEILPLCGAVPAARSLLRKPGNGRVERPEHLVVKHRKWQSWLNREVPVDWRLANETFIYEKGQKEDPGNYRLVRLTSVLGKVMEQIISSAITWHIQDNQEIRPSQHGFRKGRSCLTNLISFYDKVTCLVDEGKAMDVVGLDFSKAFDTVSHSILLEELAAHGLGSHTFHWVKNWLDGRAQRVGVNGVKSR